MNTVKLINDSINGIVWGVPATLCIIFVGIRLLIKTEAIQFRKFGYTVRQTAGKIFGKKKSSKGSITPFQAVCTALAGTVGTGNIAGVGGAIALGGPGAVFWMWVTAMLGMGTKFSEVLLAVLYREKNPLGEYVGGPMYYVKNGLDKKWHFLAYAYAVFGIMAVFGTGNATQVNTIASSIGVAVKNVSIPFKVSQNTVNTVIGTVIAVLLIMIFLGGLKRIGNVSEKLVPFMACLYIILALGVIIINIKKVPMAFLSIFKGAFCPKAVTGGIIGNTFTSIQKGISRGIFSNEAGLGTGSIAHSCADTSSAVEQGFFGIFEVFIDTIVICSLTALVILCSGVNTSSVYGNESMGANLTISGFTTAYGGWVSVFTAVAMCCFAFSTTIGWGLYGVRCFEFLFGAKYNKVFLIVYSLIAILGATVDLELIWGIADTFNGLMAIPNLIALYLLSGTVKNETRKYFIDKKVNGK